MRKLIEYLTGVVALAAVYYWTAKVGLGFDPESGFATLIWPPTGISIASLYLMGGRYWPGVAMGAFLANYTTGAAWPVALGISLGNTSEALLATYLLRNAGFRPAMDRVRDAISYLIYACAASTMVSASVGVASLWFGGVVNTSSFVQTWVAWWTGDILGALIVGSFILVGYDAVQRKARLKRPGEAVALFATIAVIGTFAYLDPFGIMSADLPIFYLGILPCLWAAFRFGLTGTILAAMEISFFAINGTVNGSGPFVRGDLSEGLLFMQLYLGTITAATLIVASVNAERIQAEKELREANALLERKVADGTLRLSEASQELKGSRRSMERRRAVLQAVLYSIGEGVIAIDAAGEPVVVNMAAMKILGMSPADAALPLPKMVKKFKRYFVDGETEIPFDDLPLVRGLRGEPTINERMIVKSDAHPKGVLVSVTATPIMDDRGTIIGAVNVFREIMSGN